MRIFQDRISPGERALCDIIFDEKIVRKLSHTYVRLIFEDYYFYNIFVDKVT